MSKNGSKSSLNERQREAVEVLKGPLLILAGAGAGKTKTIAERIRHLIRSGVAPASILAITFTNKAGREMRERVDKLLGEDPLLNKPISSLERPFVSTFHSLGVHILREQSGKLGLSKHFSIFDKDDSRRAVREALSNLGLDPKIYEPDKILSIISKEKGRNTVFEEYALHSEVGFASVVKNVWSEYEKVLSRNKALDFDDLLLKTVRLLRNDPSVRDYYRKVWQYIHIDEYQDTNKVQYEIAKLLTGDEHNIAVVGDIDQNIYSWRGADIQNILKFEKDYPRAKVVLLEENYRSTKNILDAANVVIKKNKVRVEKNLFTSNEAGEKIGVASLYDEVSEAQFIASKAKELIDKGEKPEEIAVLYRANFQSRAIEEAFLSQGIPYQLLGTKFFERKEVKDVISYIRASLDQECLSDVKRVINVPARGIGKATIAKVFAGEESSLSAGVRQKVLEFRKLLTSIGERAKQLKPSELVREVVVHSGIEEDLKSHGDEGLERLENVYELVTLAKRYDEFDGEIGLEKFLSDAALQSDQDSLDNNEGGVRLMTVHASKGLEFNTVFISGLEDGLFPHEKVTREGLSSEEREEERRLFYVALTRARRKLFLSYAQARTVFGQKNVTLPSEFIFDIPEDLVENLEVDDLDYLPRTKREILFKIDF